MYNAFISYSHAADGKLAPALQTALEKFAKPWFKKRNLNVFRDEASLSANPHLWKNIQAALENSEYLVYLASPVSAESKWVQKEIEFWIEHKSIDKLLIVLTEGEITWDDKNKTFLNIDKNSLPAVLENKFTEEPFYIDFRHLKTHEDLSLQNSLFKKEVLKLAAPLHGKEPKDLASEEVTIHRKMIRVRNAAISILVFLIITAAGAAWYANKKGIEAIKESDIAHANDLISEAKSVRKNDPTLALRLAEEAQSIYDSPDIEKELVEIYRTNSFYRILGNLKGVAKCFAILPDKKMIIAGYDDKTIRLLDFKGNTIKEFKRLAGENPEHESFVAISPDESTIFIGTTEKTSILWSLNTNSQQEFKTPIDVNSEATITAVAFSKDGKKVITSCSDFKQESDIRIWDISGNPIQHFRDSSTTTIFIALSSDESKIFLISNSEFKLLDTNGTILGEFNLFKDTEDLIISAALSPDEKRLIIGCEYGKVLLYYIDIESMSVDDNLIGHSDGIASIAFSNNGETALTASWDNTARLWDLTDGDPKTIQEFTGHTGAINSAEFSKDGKTIYTCSLDESVRQWELKENVLPVFDLHFGKLSKSISSASFSPDGTTILLGESLFDLNGNMLRELIGHKGVVEAAAFSKDGKNILTGSNDKTARLWNLEGNNLKEFKGHTAEITSVAFSPDGTTVLTGSNDKTARLWNLEGNTLKEFKGHTAEVTSVAFSPDGTTVLTGSNDKTARLWNLEGNNLKEFKGHTAEVTSVAFSPDGKTVLIGFSDNTARLCDIKGRTLTELKLITDETINPAGVCAVGFSPDGKTIFTGSTDNTAKLWTLRGSLLQELSGVYFPERTGDAYPLVTFSMNGKMIFILGPNGPHLGKVAIPLSDFLKGNKIEPLSVEQKIKYGIK